MSVLSTSSYFRTLQRAELLIAECHTAPAGRSRLPPCARSRLCSASSCRLCLASWIAECRAGVDAGRRASSLGTARCTPDAARQLCPWALDGRTHRWVWSGVRPSLDPAPSTSGRCRSTNSQMFSRVTAVPVLVYHSLGSVLPWSHVAPSAVLAMRYLLM